MPSTRFPTRVYDSADTVSLPRVTTYPADSAGCGPGVEAGRQATAVANARARATAGDSARTMLTPRFTPRIPLFRLTLIDVRALRLRQLATDRATGTVGRGVERRAPRVNVHIEELRILPDLLHEIAVGEDAARDG